MSLQLDAQIIEGLIVYVPFVIAIGLWFLRQPNQAERGALVLSSCWVFFGVLALDSIAVPRQWWGYESPPVLMSTPLPILVGWVLFWGIAAPLVGRSTVVTVVGLGLIDFVTMQLASPAVLLGERWEVGEILALLFIAAPAVALSRWQAVDNRRRLAHRLLLQLLLFSAALLWILPASVLESGSPFPDLPIEMLGVVIGLLGVAALPALISLVEFGLHGGTPWPWDQTDRPIRSGPYRYLRSPIQVSGTLVLAVLTVLHWSVELAIATAVAGAWSLYFSATENESLAERWGDDWTVVAAAQRRWLPSLRPHSASAPAVVWVDLSCDPCNDVAQFLIARSPVALELRPAVEHPTALMRMRYERADGATYDGIAAFGAALEHLHVGWALCGWFLRLPVIAPALTFVGDACGFGPRSAGEALEVVSSCR